MNEIKTYNYIIALLEAAKKAAKKLKRRKKRKLMEAFYKGQIAEGSLGPDIAKAIEGVANKIATNLGLDNYEEVKNHIQDLIKNKDEVMKPEHMYRLAPAINAIKQLLEKCKDETNPPINNCREIKQSFAEFVAQYETMKKDTPFYKRWYYWFKTLPLWKKVLVVIGLILFLYVLVVIVVKVASKAFKLVKMALTGDRDAIEKANEIVKRTNTKTLAKAYNIGFSTAAKEALLY